MRKYNLSNISGVLFRNSVAAEQDNNGSNKKYSHVGKADENTERGNWSSKREYMLSMIGYAVGLGNVWRFPYLAYKHGGGAFLIPYIIMLAVAGLPLFFMESSFGQFCSQGPINVWKAVPILQGVGITMMLVSTFVAIYYNVIIAYSIYYLFASFQYPLPWSATDCNSTALNVTSETQTCQNDSTAGQSPSEKYWDEVALQRTSSMNETGPVVWHLALCLLLAWILVGAALFKGIKSSGKVVYFTATFPYAVLFILLIRGVTLEGAKDGIEFYIGSKSNLTKLADSEVWKDAATQIFFSLSVAWGGLMALSSYNKFYNNSYQDSIIVCVTNCGTSVFAGFAIFSILGHMAHVYQRPVSEVADAGFGLAFIAYPDALSKLPISPLWSILFFVMLITLGLDSQFAGIEVITTCLQDAYPKLLKSKRGIITTAVCIVLFLLGLPCVTGAGIYWVNLIDTFCAGWILLVAGLLEVLGLSILYGGNRFIKDIEMMIGSKSALFWLWWRACWFFITPVVLSIVLVWTLYTFTSPTYGSVVYPDWGIALGWCMTAFCLIWIPILAVWNVYKASGGPWQRIKAACSPTEDWGPYLECHRGERYGTGGAADPNVIPNKFTTRL
ncbi:sodium- and chloride-dependent neutral and basic amino acid transporter B(0+)-like [Carassius carassius]|uniref:sodium- and chloride-dependent neutral and basic amino acid transporter B(0+)-like n=1 Tax=Carassius carassius TaxID=217509 RepID=UPI002869325D|nr:sodium- and chloride-dependent neutral and basic amino acid transporter B(0+)-like [Carassius carassius]XP_059394291.1 sodium- and chloride-dependent neutral and basic amino acid transporter B(0+)-like [Carassius carassius]